MDVFITTGEAEKAVRVWGPIASVTVKSGALGSSIGGKGSAWLLEGVRIGANEIVDVRQCFNDVSYIYALGNDQGKCQISLMFIIFIGSEGCKGGNNTSAISTGIDAYVKGRISKHTDPEEITIGNFSTKSWLVGIDIGQFDAQRGVCHGVATYIMQLEAMSQKG